MRSGCSDMGKNPVQRTRYSGQIERVDEQRSGSDLPAAVGTEEAPQLLLRAPSSPGRLLLEGAERLEVALGFDDPFHGCRAERPDQLVLEILDAHVEPESFHVVTGEVGAEAGSLEATPEVRFLSRVAEAGELA